MPTEGSNPSPSAIFPVSRTMTIRGLFITFEGGEGCGKSTQIRRLAASLGSRGREIVTLREPGGTPLGEEIRNLLQYDRSAGEISPEAELLLFAASRAQLVREVIVPSLNRGAIVLCDRHLDSTSVYQGVARKLESRDVDMVNRFAIGTLLPDLTLLLDLDAGEGLRRAALRGGPADRMEGEAAPFYEAVRKGYLDLAAREKERFEVIDASGDENQVAELILRAVEGRFHGLL
jgi:dTMP kinase